ncbi:MAG: hypothetical protein IT317_01305 [Anaerolineales bacterium]|nr:hypothetical protein [Anaerolineales bacterium]
MFDKLLEESVTEAEALTETIGQQEEHQASRTAIGTTVTRAIRSLPVDAMLVALVMVWAVPQKSIAWWG